MAEEKGINFGTGLAVKDGILFMYLRISLNSGDSLWGELDVPAGKQFVWLKCCPVTEQFNRILGITSRQISNCSNGIRVKWDAIVSGNRGGRY